MRFIYQFLFFHWLTYSLFAQDWIPLEKYQETISREKFCRLLDQIYNPSKTVYAYLNVTDDYAEFFGDLEKSTLDFTLRFAKPGDHPQGIKQTFKTVSELRQLGNSSSRPLQGIRIVIDPGHIGGKWADVEERAVIWGNNPIVREGDKNLQVAKLLKADLEAAGAQVYLTHEISEPVTPLRPKDFTEEAKKTVYTKYKINEETAKKREAYFQKLIEWYAELYFYRYAEIAQQAENIRTQFLPDLIICNHFNATERSGFREFTKDNRHVFFINGCYGPDEIKNPTTRFYLFSKLLEQSLNIEMIMGDAITQKMLRVANFPPASYGREKYKCRVNNNPYLYARNLAASRLYPGPCIILEPFYMNNRWTAERLAAGDYQGNRRVAGGMYRSLFQEYADAVANAVIETYSQWTVNLSNNPIIHR